MGGPNEANSWLKEGSDALLYDKNNQPNPPYTTFNSMISQSEWGDGSNYQDSSGEIKPIEPNQYGWYFADGFEGSTCDWNSGFSDSTEKLLADVDQSGDYNVNDATLIQKFVLGQIKEFPVAEKN
ncbi:MAG: hypothetical protein K2K02_03135 [Ruminococcus sp.]|nr:hypothetical protein [Ruminococcus sp.]